MPLIPISTYKRPFILFNRHLETIIPVIFRTLKNVPNYKRERIDTIDRDFLDLDWAKQGSSKLVIISHGLEGNSKKLYMQGMGKAFYNKNWDVLAWNYRGCSGEANKTNQFYHSGATDDLALVIEHSINNGYTEIALVGFSLGGNLTLKYLGEKKTKKFKEVKKACVFSVPLDLGGCSIEINKPHNILYSLRFLKSLNNKIKDKLRFQSDFMGIKNYKNTKSVYQFDNEITAPLHGFKDVDDYYNSCSSKNFIETINIPTLVVNALNDPFLSKSCLKTSLFEKSNYVFFERPSHGGHVGFSDYNKDEIFWSEKRALEWINGSTED